MTVTVSLATKYVASIWDEERDAWVVGKDRFEILVRVGGVSSAEEGLVRGVVFFWER